MNGEMNDQNQAQPAGQPPIFLPEEAVTAAGPQGRRLLFLTMPQLGLVIKRILADLPESYTYRWGYHPGHKVHVLLFSWPNGEEAGVAIPEGEGDMILDFLTEPTDVFITTQPVQAKLSGTVTAETIQTILTTETIGMPEVRFQRQQ